MGVKILNRTYINQFKPSSTTTFFLGNVGDWQRVRLECEFAKEVDLEISNTVTIADPNKLILSSGTWEGFGFDIGMTVNLDFYVYDISTGSSTFNRITFDIGNLYGATLEAVDVGTNTPKTTWGYQYGQIAPIRTGTVEVKDVLIFAGGLPQGIKLTYGQPTNSAAPSGLLNSPFDATTTSFVAENTDTFTIGVPVDFTHYLSYQSGLSIEKATLYYTGDQGHKKNYTIELTYMISCFYEDIEQLVTRTLPDFVNGNESITDNFIVEGKPTYNNPNVTIANDPKITQKKGAVGWFDENFNQLPNPFTFTPVVYTNLNGDIVSSLDYANPIVMTTTISGINNLSGLSRFQYGFVWTASNEDLYKEKPDPYHKLHKISTGGQAASLNDVFPLSPLVNSPFPSLRTGYSTDGASMDASDIQFVQNGTDVDVSITFRPNAAFQAYMDALTEDDRQYSIWVSVGDSAPATNLTDRVSLLLDTNIMQTVVEPIGAWDGMTIDFLNHTQAYTATPNLCGNRILIEDDLLAKVSFQMDSNTGTGIPKPTAITYGFLVEDAATEQQYELENTKVDLTGYPDPTQYNFDDVRGFKLGAGNDKNWVKVDYDPTNNNGSFLGVLGWYGFKIRWEDWLKRIPLPPVDFYDNTQGQNGQNNDWYHYYDTSGWGLYFFVNITADLDGQQVVYQNLREITIEDYDSNTIITTELKYYRDNNGVKGTQLVGGTDPITGNPLGVIIDGEKVFLDIEYTRSSGTWAGTANSYGVNCIEVANGAGFKAFRQLSSIWQSETDNPLEGIPGATLSTLTLVSPTVMRVECVIDSNKLTNADLYKVTGRLGCK